MTFRNPAEPRAACRPGGASKAPLAVAQAPGHMFVTDIPDREWQT